MSNYPNASTMSSEYLCEFNNLLNQKTRIVTNRDLSMLETSPELPFKFKRYFKRIFNIR